MYISVLGRGGDTYGISVYEGEEGLDKLKILASQEQLNISPYFAMYLQDNLTCYWGDREELSNKQRDIKELGYKYRGRNQWLYFQSYKTDFMPYNFDGDEVKRMIKYLSGLKKALTAYIEQKPQIAFDRGNMYCYSVKHDRISSKEIALGNFGFEAVQLAEETEVVNELKKIPKVFGTVEIDILPMFINLNDKAFDRPANPTICMVVDKKSGMVIAANVSNPETGIFDNLVNTFVDTFLGYGLPKRINVCNSIIGSILEDICDILNIKLCYEDSLSATEEAHESMMEFIR